MIPGEVRAGGFTEKRASVGDSELPAPRASPPPRHPLVSSADTATWEASFHHVL